jgi:hypothetical protein
MAFGQPTAEPSNFINDDGIRLLFMHASTGGVGMYAAKTRKDDRHTVAMSIGTRPTL